MTDDQRITFLENLAPADFARILTRIPKANPYVPASVSHLERVAALLQYIQSSGGPGPQRLRQVLQELFPDQLPEEVGEPVPTPNPATQQPAIPGVSEEYEAYRETFITEALRRVRAAGLYPAQAQRVVDWDVVLAWAKRVQEPGFRWQSGEDPIITGPGPNGKRAVHTGHHRILGGLMGGNPVPKNVIVSLAVFDPTREWQDDEEPEGSRDLFSLLGI